ncbi:MAG: hypothetical protein HOV83_19685 [Catenulispora sp.]|nr:hypothetical protein [Catenulispora sp.]
MSGTLTQAPVRSTSHRAGAPTAPGDHFIHIPRAAHGTTPNVLRAAAAAIGAVALIGAVVMTGAAADAQSAMGRVATTDAPSVRATEDFVYQLQDMDAQLLNALLVNGDTAVHVPRGVSMDRYDRDRRAADGDLEAATAALAGDKTALDQLHQVSDTFGRYQAQAARSLVDDERDGGTVAGRAPGTVVADYLAGHAILFGGDGKGGLMSAAGTVEQAGAAAIGDSASAAEKTLSGVAAGFALAGVTLFAGLAALQVYTYRRFRRLVNPALVAATVVTLVFAVGGGMASADAYHDFHSAKSDAYDSVLALSRAKALSSGANADESRWLLVHEQPGRQAEFEASFLAGSQGVAGVAARTVADYEYMIHSEAGSLNTETLTASSLDRTSGFGREFQNITYPGEGALALDAFNAYDAYLQDDAGLRALPLTDAEHLRAAVDFDTDVDTPFTSDPAFTVYSSDLYRVIYLNQAQFDRLIPAARDGIGTWTWLPYPLALLVIVLTALGVRGRLSESR